MITSIFVPLIGSDGDRPALQAAAALAAVFGAKVDCMHARLDTKSAVALATHETSWRVEQFENEHAARARMHFDEAQKRYSAANLNWQEVEGIPLEEYLYHGRMNDLVIAAREPKLPVHCAELVMRTGRPILIAPAKPSAVIGTNIAVAWKNTPECARALTASMPILLRAKKIVLLSITQDAQEKKDMQDSLEELREHLQRHGLKIEVRATNSSTDGETSALRSEIYAADCDLLIMGAYGHSRLREFVFGGMTRDILKECAVPVLMFH